ncbi:MAG TPA: hypothetical protein VK559_09800 [Ferruginibacter sp.]|nr:hypothetical protein [Ferruginibacter sp.]
MNWSLIFKLSLFGLAMGIATVYFIPSSVEPYCWLAIFIFSAYVIVKNCSANYFLHGFLVSLVNCVWIIAAHVLLFHAYASTHQQEMANMAKMPGTMGQHPRRMMVLVGPIVGVVSGLVLGLFSFIASKIVKKPQV